jgi:restriction endonuclease S subunit
MDAIDWNGQLDLSKVSYVNASKEELASATLDDGDFIYNTRNAPNLVGKCAVFHGKSGMFLFNNNILKINFDRAKAYPDFVNRMLVSEDGKKRVQGFISGTTSVAAIYQKQYLSVQIPLPPLSIQQEIVDEIEGYQKIIDGAKAVVENYKPKIDIDPEWEMVELGEVCEIKAGGTPLRSTKTFWDGEIPWYSSGELNDTYTIEPKEFITKEGLKNSNATLFPKGSLLIGMYDTAAFKMSILDREATFNQAVCGVKPNNRIDLFFLMLFFLMNKDEYLRHRVGVRQRNLNKGFISEIKIPKIPLKAQRQIVAQIEKEQELVNANKQLIEIFEQKIKDRIAKVWGK